MMMADYKTEDHIPEKIQHGWTQRRALNKWLILGLLSFVMIAGLGCLGSMFNGQTEGGLTVEIAAPSGPVSIGEAFTVEVVLSNTGNRNVTVTEILLPNSMTERATVLGVDPAGSGLQNKFAYDMMIAPNGRETVIFHFQAVSPGEIKDPVSVKTTSDSITVPVSVVIAADQSDVVVEPTATASAVMGDVIPFQAVVQITALVEFYGDVIDGWTGSGTIISEDGLILTNAHVVLSDRFYTVVDLVISITEEPDQPPKEMFYADVLQADYNLDLAVIKIRSDLNGNPPNFSALGIEPVKIGRAETLKLGDPLVIIGYPGIGGETITLTRGEVSGFTAEAPYGNRAYIKTSATIAGGNSGGLAATPQGEIIGVPTQVGSGDLEGQVVDCRALADTNRDGVIDEFDNCVPTGGFINALRPINLALPLIDAALAGQVAIIEEPPSEEYVDDYDYEGDVLLYDTFEDNRNKWLLEDYNEGWADILDRQLVIKVIDESTYIYSILPDSYSNIIMAVDYEVLLAAGDGDFGFVCGYVDKGNFTVLEISEDGYYTIWALVDDKPVSVVDWTPSSAIPTGGINTLSAYCGYDGFALAVNSTLLVDVDSDIYWPGQAGLFVGTWDQREIMVGFSEFAIYKP